MNPITPERFIKLLVESNTEKVKLWDITANDYDYYSHIKKRAHSSFIACKPESHNFCILNYLYESKPETPLEKLDRIIRYTPIAHQTINDIKAWRDKYESQLKELK